MKLLLSLLLSVLTVTAYAGQTLKFATEATYPPFVSIGENNQVSGFETDVIKAMCQQMDVGCEFSHHPWESLIVGVKLGKFDAVYGGMEITELREKIVMFTQPIYRTQVALLVNKNKIAAFDTKSLQQQTIGVQRGTTFEQYLRENQAGVVKLKNFANIQEALLDLKTGRVTGVLGDAPVLKDWLANHDSDEQYQLLMLPPEELSFFGQGYGLALKQDNTPLLKKLNQALAKIKDDGTYDKLYQQYFDR